VRVGFAHDDPATKATVAGLLLANTLMGKDKPITVRKMTVTRIRARGCACVLNRALALLFLFAVPGLSTLAKVNWYLPQSDPAHYVTTASKMKVGDGRATFNIDALDVLPSVCDLRLSPQQEVALFLEQPRETSVPRMLLRAILLHRSPPSESA
jgi:hypothetical protein